MIEAIETLFAGAISLHQSQRLHEAERAYGEILAAEPNHAGALHLLGVIRQQQGCHEEALELIGRAIAAMPDKAVYRNNYGAALLSLERLAEARESFRAALANRPDYADALANLGLAEKALGDDEAALACFRRTLAIDPRHRDARRRLAVLLQEMGRQEEAVAVFGDEIAAAPSAVAYTDLGNLFVRAGRATDAIEAYSKAIGLDPNHALAHYNLAQAWDEQHDTVQARRHFARAAELRPDKPLWQLRAEVCGPAVFESTEEIEEYCRRVEEALQALVLWSAGTCRRFSLADEDRNESRDQPQELAEGNHTPSAPAPLPTTLRAVPGEGTKPADGTRRVPATLELDDILEAGAFPSFGLSYLGRNQRRLKEQFAGLYEACFRERPDAAVGDGLGPGPLPAERRGGRSLQRIGFLVTRRHEGIFARCMSGLLRYLNPERFEPVVLAPRTSIDVLKQRPANDRLRYIAFRDTFADAVRTIREAACDAICYWEVGSDAMNYFLPFARLAAVQCTSHGSLITTGVPAIDYFFSSDLMERIAARSDVLFNDHEAVREHERFFAAALARLR